MFVLPCFAHMLEHTHTHQNPPTPLPQHGSDVLFFFGGFRFSPGPRFFSFRFVFPSGVCECVKRLVEAKLYGVESISGHSMRGLKMDLNYKLPKLHVFSQLQLLYLCLSHPAARLQSKLPAFVLDKCGGQKLGDGSLELEVHVF